MKLGDVLKVDKDNLINIQDTSEYIIAGVQNYGKGILNKRTARGSELNMKKYQMIKENQLMWCKVDTKNGAFGITTKEHVGSLASTNMCLANIDTKKVKVEFLQLLFTQPSFYNNITSKSTGTTNRQYLTPVQLLEEISIPDMSIAEQEKFMQKFDKIMSLNLPQELQQQSDLIKKLSQSILQDAVQGKLLSYSGAGKVEDAHQLLQKIKAEKQKLIAEGKLKKEKELPPIRTDEIPFELPEGWIWCRLGEVCEKIGDVDHKMPFEVQTGYPYISPKDFYGKNGIDFTNSKKISTDDFKILSKKIKPERNDIVFPRYGTIGVNRFIDFDMDFLASYSCAVIKNMKTLMNPSYVFYYSISPHVQNEIKKHTVKTTQPNVGIKSIQEFLFPLPPLSEQDRIVSKVEELMQVCEALEEEVEQSKTQLEHLMQSILSEAFKGN